jgi:hypothetical protein
MQTSAAGVYPGFKIQNLQQAPWLDVGQSSVYLHVVWEKIVFDVVAKGV